MVGGLTSAVVVDSEAARKPQKREAAERVQILSLGTSWHILAHLGTSWRILAHLGTMHHAASWHRTAIFWYWRCQVQLHSRYLRQEVAQLRRQNAELQNQAWKIIFWGRKVTIWDSQDALWLVGFGLGITHGLHMEVGRPDIEQIQDSGRMTVALTRIDYMGFDCLYPFFRDVSAPDSEACVSKYFLCQWHCFAWHVDIHSYLLVARVFWSWHLNRTHEEQETSRNTYHLHHRFDGAQLKLSWNRCAPVIFKWRTWVSSWKTCRTERWWADGKYKSIFTFFFTYSQLLSSLWQSSRGCEAALTLWWSFDIFDYLKCSSLRHCYVDALHISDSQSRTRNGAEHLRPGAMVNLQSLDMSRPGCWWIWWRGWSFVLHLMLHALIWSLAEWTSSILFCCTGSGAN